MKIFVVDYYNRYPEYDIRGDSGSANHEPVADSSWGKCWSHRCCNITDRGPQKQLNYNDKGPRLMKQYLLLLYRTATVMRQPSGTPLLYVVERASHEQLDMLCCVFFVAVTPLKMTILILLLLNMTILFWTRSGHRHACYFHKHTMVPLWYTDNLKLPNS